MFQRAKRSERVVAIAQQISAQPGRIFTLRELGQAYNCAKSTLSEDVALVRGVLQSCGLGRVETISGAAGGVRFYPFRSDAQDWAFVEGVCRELSHPDRILPGGFIYNTDVFSRPETTWRMGEILAKRFHALEPDVVATVEAMGVPIALMTARALGKPLVTARRGSHAAEGSRVTINYMSASSKRLQTMSMSRRMLQEGQRALIVDDFMKGGGTLAGLRDMMAEFRVSVVGVGVILATVQPERKSVASYDALMILDEVDEQARRVSVRPASWL